MAEGRIYSKARHQTVRDPELSLRAKGVLSVIVELLNCGETLTMKRIGKYCTDGADSVRSGIRELVNKGYLSIVRTRADGQYSKVVYTVIPREVHNNSKKE